MEVKTEDKRNNIVITICSTKGGVGKTTLTANIGGLLADLNYKVLLIDGDTQGSLSSHFNIVEKAEGGLTNLVRNDGDPLDAISKTDISNLDIAVSNDPDKELETWIAARPAGRTTLKNFTLKILRPHYDFILIDSIGTDSPLQHTTVLAADLLISPIPPDVLSAREFKRGTLGMIEMIEALSPIGQLYGLVYRMENTKDSKLFANELTSETFAESKSRIRIIDTVIPDLVVYKNAATQKQPVHRLDKRATRDMCTLISEILPHLASKCDTFMEGN